jgi:hypothetical protein
MVIPILVGIVGLMIGGRTKPVSKHKKMLMLGPRSGAHYTVEDMPQSAIVIVHAKDGTVVTFNRSPENGKLKFKCSTGNQGTVTLVREDFEPPPELPTVSGTSTESRPSGFPFPRAVS